MAYEQPSFVVGVFPADADLSADVNQYCFAKVAAATATVGTGTGGAAVTKAGAGVPVLGVLQNNPMLGEAATVMCGGITKLIAGGTIAVGALIAADANGHAVTAATGAYAVGVALESAVANDIFTVLLQSNGKQ